jgi:hypothetical protein
MNKLFFTFLCLFGGIGYANAQITFEEAPLPAPDMDYTQTIDTGNYTIMHELWNQTAFYGRKNPDSSYTGFTYSNIQDSTTPGMINDRAAFPAIGYFGSAQYGVGHGNCGVYLDRLLGVKSTQEAYVTFLYITNATCAVLSMEYGDSTAKKFGGIDGTDPDWFLLTIKGYNRALSTVDSFQFYLADFRSDDSTEDYIIKDWTLVELPDWGRLDSLSFSLSSSDTGALGMNTPAYFCVDRIGIERNSSVNEDIADVLHALVYPNPAKTALNVQAATEVDACLYNISGQLLFAGENVHTIDVSRLAPGTYFVRLSDKAARSMTCSFYKAP